MKRLMLAVLFLGCSFSAHATLVHYQVENYSTPGYSASWLHTATGCKHGNLYMCGTKYRMSGQFSGHLSGNVLTDLNGQLTVRNSSNAIIHTINIMGGTIGGAFNWMINTTYGLFIFEDLGFGSAAKPNTFAGSHMILWGQNIDAYTDGANAWGMDLYARQVAVAEPGTLGAMAFGLLGLVALRRFRSV